MALGVKRRRERATKSMRLEARLNPEQKRRIEYAARLRGTSISDFIVSSADDAATRTIDHHEIWTLTNRDREAFVKAMLRPPVPNERMKEALREYGSRVSTS